MNFYTLYFSTHCISAHTVFLRQLLCFAVFCFLLATKIDRCSVRFRLQMMAAPRSRLSALSEQQTLLSKRFETLMAVNAAGEHQRQRHAQSYEECVARQEQQLASTRSALEAFEATCMEVPAVPMSLLPPEVLGSIAALAGHASRLANSALRFAHTRASPS